MFMGINDTGGHMRILVVEDEVELNEAIVEGLTLEGYAVDASYDGEEALFNIEIENYDLIILDLNIPKIDGYDVLKRIREYDDELKVLILSARSDVDDKVLGLDLGASDYLTKPFAFKELEARVRNLLRRRFKQHDNILSYDTLTYDFQKKEAYVDGIVLALTKKEKAILSYLLLNKERVVSQEELIEHVWDINANNVSNSVRVHIASLRKKLRNMMAYEVLKTKIGEGYYFD